MIMMRRDGFVDQASLVVSCKNKFSHLILFSPTVLQFKFCNTSNQNTLKVVSQFFLARTAVSFFKFERTSEIENWTFMNAKLVLHTGFSFSSQKTELS